MSKERVIYLSELRNFFHKKRAVFFIVGLFCFLATSASLLFLLEPSFRAEAAFRQARSTAEETSSLQSILQNFRMAPEESSALSVMQSKRILGRVIEMTGLQVRADTSGNMKKLILAEVGLAKNGESFQFENVCFNQEQSELIFIRPLTKNAFEVLNQNQELLVRGLRGRPVQWKGVRLTLVKMPRDNAAFAFHLIPKRKIYKELGKTLKIKTSRLDSSVLQLSFCHPERETAIRFLNTLMEQFQHHLQEEHEELALQQLSYLQKRRDQLGLDFDEALTEHVAYLKEGVGAEGFLGLAQEVEMLSEPKETYSAKKHQLDLDLKKWKEPHLIAAADYPWKEGALRKEELGWEHAKIHPSLISTEEFAGVSLETAEKLHRDYAQERDQLSSQIASLKAFGEKMEDDDFELTALSQIFTDEVSQKLIQKGSELSLQFADRANHSDKELKRLGDEMTAQKRFLREHLLKKIQMLQIKLDLIEKKMVGLKQVALELIEKERGLVEQKLSEISAKMGELPEKWRLESQLKLKKELTMQIIEGVTQLSESKVVNHHLFHVGSKPLDLADAPPDIQPPHLILFSSMGAIAGMFFFSLGSFLRAALRGLPVSADYLRDRKLPFISASKERDETLQRMMLEIEPHEVVAIIGDFGKELAKTLARSGQKVLRIEIGQEHLPRAFQGHEVAGVETLHHRSLGLKLGSWKREYDAVLIEVNSGITSANALRCLTIADRFILNLSEEKAEELSVFENKKVLCVLKNFF